LYSLYVFSREEDWSRVEGFLVTKWITKIQRISPRKIMAVWSKGWVKK
jgi:hypothetical protein